MNVGYARISTGEQKMDLPLDALDEAGCEKIYTDELSGAMSDRPGLQEAIDYVRPGDTLVVRRLDRFGRSLKDLVTAAAGKEGRLPQPQGKHRHDLQRGQAPVPYL